MEGSNSCFLILLLPWIRCVVGAVRATADVSVCVFSFTQKGINSLPRLDREEQIMQYMCKMALL